MPKIIALHTVGAARAHQFRNVGDPRAFLAYVFGQEAANEALHPRARHPYAEMKILADPNTRRFTFPGRISAS